jgi:hypothetical protein
MCVRCVPVAQQRVSAPAYGRVLLSVTTSGASETPEAEPNTRLRGAVTAARRRAAVRAYCKCEWRLGTAARTRGLRLRSMRSPHALHATRRRRQRLQQQHCSGALQRVSPAVHHKAAGSTLVRAYDVTQVAQGALSSPPELPPEQLVLYCMLCRSYRCAACSSYCPSPLYQLVGLGRQAMACFSLSPALPCARGSPVSHRRRSVERAGVCSPTQRSQSATAALTCDRCGALSGLQRASLSLRRCVVGRASGHRPAVVAAAGVCEDAPLRRALALFTNLFPVWILLGACTGLLHPPAVVWFKVRAPFRPSQHRDSEHFLRPLLNFHRET